MESLTADSWPAFTPGTALHNCARDCRSGCVMPDSCFEVGARPGHTSPALPVTTAYGPHWQLLDAGPLPRHLHVPLAYLANLGPIWPTMTLEQLESELEAFHDGIVARRIAA